MRTLRQFVLGLAVVLVAAVFGAALYESLVLAPNFQVGQPDSLEHFRRFMQVATPGNFFRIVVPATDLCLLLGVVLSWRAPRLRWPVLAALLLLIAADVVTFSFHYPRNHILFGVPLQEPLALLQRTAAEWALGNWVRIALAGAATMATLSAFARDCREQSATEPSGAAERHAATTATAAGLGGLG